MLRQILEAIDQFAPDAVLFGPDDRRSSVREEAYPPTRPAGPRRTRRWSTSSERAGALLDAPDAHHSPPRALRPTTSTRRRRLGPSGPAGPASSSPPTTATPSAHISDRNSRCCACHQRRSRLTAAQPGLAARDVPGSLPSTTWSTPPSAATLLNNPPGCRAGEARPGPALGDGVDAGGGPTSTTARARRWWPRSTPTARRWGGRASAPPCSSGLRPRGTGALRVQRR